MKRLIFLLGIVIAIYGLQGCAAIFSSSIANIPATSEPAGAEVIVNGQFMGTTPCVLNLKKNQSYNIQFRLNGYTTQVQIINNHVGAGWVVLDILGGFLPVIVDAATGSWMVLDQKNVNESII